MTCFLTAQGGFAELHFRYEKQFDLQKGEGEMLIN